MINYITSFTICQDTEVNVMTMKKSYIADVAVVGGGTAGVFAAISAARTGAKTILIEKNSIIGGTMTVAGVNYPGLFFAWGKQIIDGPCWEAIKRTADLGGAVIPEIKFKPEKHWYEQIKLNKFIFTSVLFQMCEECGVQLICNSMISSVNDDCTEMIITEKTGMSFIQTKKIIDTTGDANVVQMAGYDVEKSTVQQPATLQNRISGYCKDNISEDELREKFKKEKFPAYITADHILSYIDIGRIDLHIPCTDADTSLGKTKLECRAYHDMLKLYIFLKGINGLENLEIDYTASETGVRETNRILGEKKVTAADYIEGVLYDDSVCYAFYPIDLHVMDGIKKTYHKENVVAKIPYGALIPKNSKNILCAGRCISSDTYANSAIRVEAVCMATGQAAGCAAALAAQFDIAVKDVQYQKLCNALKKIGAITDFK